MGCPTSVAAGLGLLVAAAIILIVEFRRKREGFVSKKAQEVYASSRDLFSRTAGNATYTQFQSATPHADPVVYIDVRKLWRHGDLTPENVQNVL